MYLSEIDISSALQDRCFRFEGAGDQHCGRVLCGLPSNSRLFAMLPPHLNYSSPATMHAILELISLAFPVVGRQCQAMLQYGVASLLAHEQFLKASLPTRSPLWANPLFTDQERRCTVKDKLISDLTSQFLRATGVPPHITLSGQIDDLGTQIGDLPNKLAAAVQNLIEDYSAAHGNITQEALERTVRRILQEFHSAPRPSNPASMDVSEGEVSERNSCTPSTQYYTWKGGFHLLPEEFQFPDSTIEQTWFAWWKGSNGIPPYRMLSPSDLSSIKQRNRLSDIKVLMKHIESKLAEQDLLLAKPSSFEVREMYVSAVPYLTFMEDRSLPHNNRGRRGNAKRPQQWKVPTAVKKLRTFEKSVN